MAITPSKYQKAVYDWIDNGVGHAVINAVAGSGKTTTLIEAASKITEAKVLFVAFNKSIVEELKSKLPGGILCRTIHSIGYQCLQNHLNHKPETNEDKYTIIVSPFAAHIHEKLEMEFVKMQRKYDAQVLKQKRIKPLTHLSAWDQPDTISNIIETQPVTEPIPPPHTQVIAQLLKEIVKLVRLRLVNYNDKQAVLDLISHYGLESDIEVEIICDVIPKILKEGVRQALESGTIDFDDMVWLPQTLGIHPLKFQWVLIDEAQDLNPAQFDLVLKMVKDGGRMLFVGDPKQAIYGFAGADHNSFYAIKNRINALEFPLSICYRCPKLVIDLAKEYVPTIECSPNSKEGLILEIYESQIEEHLIKSDFIICRFTAPLISLCIKLIGNRVAAKVLGRDIGRQLNEIILGVTHLKGYSYSHFLQYLDKYKGIRIQKLKEYKNSEERIRSLEDRITGIVKCYNSFTNCKDAKMLCREIDQLFADTESAITLCTIHKSKGREFQRVFILDFDELPFNYEGQQEWQLEQEQNLTYVAVTRSMDQLYLVKTNPKK